MCFSRLTTSSLYNVKNTKILEFGVLFSNEGIGNVDEVVLKEWMLENAIRVRF